MPREIERLRKISEHAAIKRELEDLIEKEFNNLPSERKRNTKQESMIDRIDRRIEEISKRYKIGKGALRLYLSMDKKLSPRVREGGKLVYNSHLPTCALKSGKDVSLASKINGTTIELLYAMEELKDFREELESIAYLLPESTRKYLDRKRIERENETEPTPIRNEFEAKAFKTSWKKLSKEELEETYSTILKIENHTDLSTTLNAFLETLEKLHEEKPSMRLEEIKEATRQKLFYHIKSAISEGDETPKGREEHSRIKSMCEKSPALVKLLLEKTDFRNVWPWFLIFILQCAKEDKDIAKTETLYKKYLGNKLRNPPLVFIDLAEEDQNSIIEISKKQVYDKNPRLKKTKKTG